MFGLRMLAIFMQCISAAAFPRAKPVPALQHLQAVPPCYGLLAADVVRAS